MFKATLKSFFILCVFVPAVFADDDSLSAFHTQGDLSYPEPIGESAYFATKAPMPSKSSGYFGLNFGSGFAFFKPDITVTKTSTGVSKHQAYDKSAIDYHLGLFGGYGVNLSHFYIGGELSLDGSLLRRTIEGTINGSSMKLSIKRPINAGFDIIPGYLTSSRNILFYGRLGVGGGLFNFKLVDNTNKAEVSNNKVIFALRGGVGMEYFMSDTFGLRVEYVYTRYNKFANTHTAANKYRYDLDNTSAHRINLGLSIHF